MKKILALGALAIGIGAAFAFTGKKKEGEETVDVPNDNANPGSLEPQKLKSILFIGDSNTVLPGNYADQFVKLYPTVRAKKIAKMGEKTDWMLAELKKELAVNKYDVVCILGGSNDIYALNSIDSATKNLGEMYDLVYNTGAAVVAITPPNKDFYIKKTDEKQELLSSLIWWLEAGVGNAKHRGIWINFREMTNNKKFFSAEDGYLHPNEAAHTLLVNQVIKELVTYGWMNQGPTASVPKIQNPVSTKTPTKSAGGPPPGSQKSATTNTTTKTTTAAKPTVKDLTDKQQITKRRDDLIKWVKANSLKVFTPAQINNAVIAFGSKMSDYEVNASFIFVFAFTMAKKALDKTKDAWLITAINDINKKYNIFNSVKK